MFLSLQALSAGQISLFLRCSTGQISLLKDSSDIVSKEYLRYTSIIWTNSFWVMSRIINLRRTRECSNNPKAMPNLKQIQTLDFTPNLLTKSSKPNDHLSTQGRAEHSVNISQKKALRVSDSEQVLQVTGAHSFPPIDFSQQIFQHFHFLNHL